MDAIAGAAVLIWIKNAAPKFLWTSVLRALLGAIGRGVSLPGRLS
jgi:hypothetical protein